MTEKEIVSIAKKNGYDTARYVGVWNGYEVWTGDFTDGKVHEVGLPLFILIKDGKYKLGYDEWMEIMDELYPYMEVEA
ncbi:hypothetical protein [Eubacterium pyruvativorans]|uniref:hypothetical protein n=1 Tax=Eubacterium pyruvativorans TaxID=155865 RepID=UPI003F8AF0BA